MTVILHAVMLSDEEIASLKELDRQFANFCGADDTELGTALQAIIARAESDVFPDWPKREYPAFFEDTSWDGGPKP